MQMIIECEPTGLIEYKEKEVLLKDHDFPKSYHQNKHNDDFKEFAFPVVVTPIYHRYQGVHRLIVRFSWKQICSNFICM